MTSNLVVGLACWLPSLGLLIELAVVNQEVGMPPQALPIMNTAGPSFAVSLTAGWFQQSKSQKTICWHTAIAFHSILMFVAGLCSANDNRILTLVLPLLMHVILACILSWDAACLHILLSVIVGVSGYVFHTRCNKFDNPYAEFDEQSTASRALSSISGSMWVEVFLPAATTLFGLLVGSVAMYELWKSYRRNREVLPISIVPRAPEQPQRPFPADVIGNTELERQKSAHDDDDHDDNEDDTPPIVEHDQDDGSNEDGHADKDFIPPRRSTWLRDTDEGLPPVREHITENHGRYDVFGDADDDDDGNFAPRRSTWRCNDIINDDDQDGDADEDGDDGGDDCSVALVMSTWWNDAEEEDGTDDTPPIVEHDQDDGSNEDGHADKDFIPPRRSTWLRDTDEGLPPVREHITENHGRYDVFGDADDDDDGNFAPRRSTWRCNDIINDDDQDGDADEDGDDGGDDCSVALVMSTWWKDAEEEDDTDDTPPIVEHDQDDGSNEDGNAEEESMPPRRSTWLRDTD
eukprot:CAMPEP_0197707070 /NCGR_PEP_ID=MMETSP1338-20131121/127265_1 /TAXON_ID=43686 ORGANISM="Pelagodinium beii, Strain RCC1491" /NCGR_SAMPLE_ID=MMETSP1338 /ASSEMBLY_ACC=CAM_ASM_000754 /LENGTH=518 /DNA_ID=CAMNT_0043290991 /DNA_START=77 /DNA_END=1633 /DNA_ORIENTATION=-